MRSVRIFAALMAIGLLACTPRLGNWAKTGTTEDQRSQDLLECEVSARQTIQRDRTITRDIASARQPDAMSGGAFVGAPASGSNPFPGALTQYQEDQARRRLVSDCMTGRGYAVETQ